MCVFFFLVVVFLSISVSFDDINCERMTKRKESLKMEIIKLRTNRNYSFDLCVSHMHAMLFFNVSYVLEKHVSNFDVK